MTKGNNGKARRLRTMKQLLCFSLSVLTFTVAFLCFRRNGNDNNNKKYGIPMNGHTPSRRLGNHKNKQHAHHRGGGGGDTFFDETGMDPHEVAVRFRRDLLAQAETKDEASLLEDILEGRLNLMDIMGIDQELERAPSHSYAGVYGRFCKLNFAVHKANPSSVPMFRDIVGKSPDCDDPVEFDLKKVAYLARQRDQQVEDSESEQVPRVLNFTAAAFHESRCGSTLVANSMIAMDPEKHRTYSESSPPIAAMKSVCPNFQICSEEQAAKILQDVIYMMSRTDDPKEERVFFKFQSITSQSISTFQMAFPKVPWMYVYREPVQVMMSHVKDDPKLSRAICTRSRVGRPPKIIQAIARRHGYDNSRDLESTQYCAAHLASLTESAVENLNDMAIPINYAELPGIMWEKIMPRIFGRPLSQKEIDNMESVSHEYSKGRGQRAGEFKGDSEQKAQAASTEVKEAAEEFLTESYDKLNAFKPKLLQ